MRRALSITWDVAMRLIEVFVVLAMFQIPKSAFESLVIGLLVLTYLSVTVSSEVFQRALAEKFNQDTARFIALAGSLRLDVEPYEAALAEDQGKLQKSGVTFAITSVFRFLLGLIVLVYLLHALWV